MKCGLEGRLVHFSTQRGGTQRGLWAQTFWVCLLTLLLLNLVNLDTPESLSFLSCEMGPRVVEGTQGWGEDTLAWP